MSTYGPVTSSGTVTSYLPISSRWPSSSECSSLFIDKGPYAINPGLMLYDPEYASVVEHAPTCLPPEAYSMWYPNITHWIDTVPTSTALGGYVMNCPEAYTTYMSTSTDSLITTIGCCPSSYTYDQADPLTLIGPGCFSHLPEGVITFAQLPNGQNVYQTSSYNMTTTSSIWACQITGYIVRDIVASHTTSATSSDAVAQSPSLTTSSSSAAAVTSFVHPSSTTLHTNTVLSSVTGTGTLSATHSATSSASSGINVSDQIALGIGIPSAIAAVIAAYYACRQARRRFHER